MKILRTHRRQPAGFTLIELLIAVTILGIIAAIAYPSYQEHVRKARRADAISKLLDVAQRQERFYARGNSYVDEIDDLGGADSAEGYYEIAITNPSCSFTVSGNTRYSCFTATATAKADGLQARDTACQTFTITHTGARSATAAGGAATDACW